MKRTTKINKGIVSNIGLETPTLSTSSMEQQLLPCKQFTVPLIELSYINQVRYSERPQIKTSDAAYRLLYQSWNKKKIELQEEFKVLLLNRSNHVLGLYELSTGGVTSTIADPRLIFAAAIKANACAIILAHNHPSGQLSSSKADEHLTHKMQQAGSLLDIRVLDHIVVTNDGYYSFADEGLM